MTDRLTASIEREALHQGLRHLAAGKGALGVITVWGVVPDCLVLMGSNREVRLVAVVHASGQVAVPGKIPRRLVGALGCAPVELEQTANQVVLRSGRGVFRLFRTPDRPGPDPRGDRACSLCARIVPADTRGCPHCGACLLCSGDAGERCLCWKGVGASQ